MVQLSAVLRPGCVTRFRLLQNTGILDSVDLSNLLFYWLFKLKSVHQAVRDLPVYTLDTRGARTVAKRVANPV